VASNPRAVTLQWLRLGGIIAVALLAVVGAVLAKESAEGVVTGGFIAVLVISVAQLTCVQLGQRKAQRVLALLVFGFSAANSLTTSAPLVLTPESVTALILGVAFSFPLLPWLLGTKDSVLQRWPHVGLAVAYSGAKILLMFSVLLLSVATLASGAYNPFIYFRF